MQKAVLSKQIWSTERNAVRVALDIQPFGLQIKVYLTCLLCTKCCPDVAYFLEINGPAHAGYESQ